MASVRPDGRVVVYAWKSSHDQRADLDRQVARRTQEATETGHRGGGVGGEVGASFCGVRLKLRGVVEDA
ncbi:hypothetical protein KC221_25640, partial [Mycobacterium tuberculosis]|nr:hypothetical protein [Mycobacterium tuberculosis]